MDFDIVVVGGGIAGLTSAAYLCKDGYKVLVCEKEKTTGGLVNSFDFNGFTFDGGIRAIENSGIVLPMFKQLGIDIDFVKNNVSIGIEKNIIRLASRDSLLDYQNLLNGEFPDDKIEIQAIINEVKRVMIYMDILYDIDNPIFLDLKNNKEYLYKTILPWVFKYITTSKKVFKLTEPIDEYLAKFTKNTTLIDIIAQHFFRKTPSFFALSYFSLYLDYQYPKGGTGVMIEKLEKFILNNGGEIRTDTNVSKVDPQNKIIQDLSDNTYNYKKMIWTADLKFLYEIMDLDNLKNKSLKQKAIAQKNAVSDKIGGDSILTVYLTLDMDKSYFEDICSAHLFYTPKKKGLSYIDLQSLMIKDKKGCPAGFTQDKEALIDWIQKYYELTTYEIACPVMRDENLAPKGKTGLIVSTLMDYNLVKHISESGWYDSFKKFSENTIIDILNKSVFPGIKAKIIDQFSSTPLTLESRTGNSQGAITGWAFTNSSIPVIHSMPKIAQSILTPLPDIFQAGQWSFSPSGLPISILTGKLAADKVKKQLKKRDFK
ncbi:MAG: NAD(P)/FAD-dependent oxidoreductase [Eubacteriales bacterium]